LDFGLYARVLWRFKLVVIGGLLLATGAAVLSVIRIAPDGVSYRQDELWASTARLGVTQVGFPWGRLFAQPATPTDPSTDSESGEANAQIPLANPDRFNSLAILYAELATSDRVRALMRRDGAVRGQIIATPLRDPDSGVLLPLIDLTAISNSPQAATGLASRGVDALQTYIEEEQRTNAVPASDRVVLQEVTRPTSAHVFQPRSKTLPAVIFLAVMFVTVALVFVLENFRPRFREAAEDADAVVARPAHRRTA
jgi:hypothetical protein